MSRIVENTNRPSQHTKVICNDEPGQGGMCHEYIVKENIVRPPDAAEEYWAVVNFQNGPIKENGVNGCMNEDLILIVLDRLRGAQKGDFGCRENALAITKLEEALLWLDYRTNTRVSEGVEGK